MGALYVKDDEALRLADELARRLLASGVSRLNMGDRR